MVDDNMPLRSLGARLRDERLRRNETQTMFAARIGVSIPTLRKMEGGDPTVQIGYWVAALDILCRMAELDLLLAPPEDLFAKLKQAEGPGRKRARGRRG